MNTLEKLLTVQTKLKAPKSQFNKFGNYNYRNCEDILEAAKPLCDEVKAVITVTDQLVQIGDRYYIQALANFWDCEGEGKIQSTAFAREEENKKGMDSSQVTGSTSSYARKYALNGLLAIDDTKDSDTTNKGATTTKNKASDAQGQKAKPAANRSNAQESNTDANKEASEENVFVSAPMIKTVTDEIKRTGLTEDVILEMFNLKKMEDMTVQQYKSCMNKFKITPSKAEVAKNE